MPLWVCKGAGNKALCYAALKSIIHNAESIRKTCNALLRDLVAGQSRLPQYSSRFPEDVGQMEHGAVEDLIFADRTDGLCTEVRPSLPLVFRHGVIIIL